ncbi:MAG: HDOD domain-containing protein [bacterium]|nr:HDOD domain-containing protein [bacterium]
MINPEIVGRLLEVEDLPTLPAVMNRILATVENEASSAQDLTAILETDHAISARVLRLANSAFYGLRHRADSIRRAVVIIGFEAVRMLALATSVFDTLSGRSQFALDPEDFWLHSLGAAKATQLLATRMGGLESPEGCFTAGLLHDMGKYVLSLVQKEGYVWVVQSAEEREINLHELERDQFGVTHPEIGMWIANRWRFPKLIVDSIGFQHELGQYSGKYPSEVSLIALASDMARAAEFGNGGDFGKPSLRPTDRDLPLSVAGVEEALEELAAFRSEARQFLDLLDAS